MKPPHLRRRIIGANGPFTAILANRIESVNLP